MIQCCGDNPSNKKVLKSSETGSSHLTEVSTSCLHVAMKAVEIKIRENYKRLDKEREEGNTNQRKPKKGYSSFKAHGGLLKGYWQINLRFVYSCDLQISLD